MAGLPIKHTQDHSTPSGKISDAVILSPANVVTRLLPRLSAAPVAHVLSEHPLKRTRHLLIKEGNALDLPLLLLPSVAPGRSTLEDPDASELASRHSQL